MPLSIASIVGVAALLALLPVRPEGSVIGSEASVRDVRLAIGGSDRQRASASPEGQRGMDAERIPAELFLPVTVGTGQRGGDVVPGVVASPPVADTSSTPGPVPVPLLADGTLVVGYAPDTTVEDGARLIRRYVVRKGDTLARVAKRFGVSKATVYWVNRLRKQALKVGQELRIPPVSGLIYRVGESDTLARVARRFAIDSDRIVEVNSLDDRTLVVGQVLVLPGVKLDPIPVPKPRVRLTSTMRHAWPLPIGGLLTTTFSTRHPGIDLAAPSGTPVRAIDAGRVVWAGWKNNGGGYVVVLEHASGMTSTYNHNRGVNVRVGTVVAAGQKIAEVGSTGISTGPHLDLRITMNGRFVNPLSILRR